MSDAAESWAEQARLLRPAGDALIDGCRMPARSGRRFDKRSPIDGRLLGHIASCDSADVDLAVAAARRTFEQGCWRNRPPRERRDVLLRLADRLEAEAAGLALLETLDMGKPITDSVTIDVPLSAECVRFYAELIDKRNDEVTPTGPDVLSVVLREPLGVVGAVVPWNFPLLMAVWKVAPALAAGNSVVLKPAEQSPLSAIRLGELALEAGLPAGVLNIVPGFGETAGQALGRHMDVDMLAFTGSTEVGKLFLRYAGESNMKRVSLECGGKTPHIIMPDAPDLERAAEAAAAGIFANQGEVCNAGSRVLVHESILAPFTDLVLKAAARWQPGDPLDPATRMGAMVDARQQARVLGYIEQGRREGAQLLLGGRTTEPRAGGYYIEPTVFGGVDNRMVIAQEEIFGPVMGLIGFSSLADAIAIANDSIYGLAAAIWTRDIATAMTAARGLKAGSVWINSFDAGDITTPFGGFKQSGFGRDKGIHALDKYTDLKSVWFDIAGSRP